MRHVVLALLLASAPAFAAEPVAQPTTTTPAPASAADVDRLLAAMDMKSMMAGMMQQIEQVQGKMLTDAFGADLTEAKRKELQEVQATTSAIINKHLAWEALEPVVRKVYAQVFSQREVQAMTAFYSSPEGAAILKKSPQAMAITMQEIQPVMMAALAEVKAEIEKRAAAKPADKK